jgi:predicted DNA-binding protein
MSETVSARLQKELRENLVNKCNDLGCSVNDYIKDAVESKLNGSKTIAEPISFDKAFEHMKDCNRCNNSIIDKGYVLVSMEELKKYNLIPKRNPVEK